MFRINLRNLVKNKILISKEYHLQPNIIEGLPYYEYEWILEEINIVQKDQETQQQEQTEQYEQMKQSMNVGSMMKDVKSNMNLGNLGSNIKMPKVDIPKFK